MNYHQAQWIATAADQSQWPDSELPEIVFAGRSNAGKSSLINTLVNRNNLAYTAAKPGKTRLLNFFRIDEKVVFTDVPGYGYAKGGDQTAVVFAKLIDPYFHFRKQLSGMVLVLDIRRIPSREDIQMAEYARNAHLPMRAVCMKADKLSRQQQTKQITVIADTMNLPKTAVLPVSSIKKSGIDEVWNAIDHMIQ